MTTSQLILHLQGLIAADPAVADAQVFSIDERFMDRYELWPNEVRVKRRRDKAKTPQLIIG